jgi:hypothetical protein
LNRYGQLRIVLENTMPPPKVSGKRPNICWSDTLFCDAVPLDAFTILKNVAAS